MRNANRADARLRRQARRSAESDNWDVPVDAAVVRELSSAFHKPEFEIVSVLRRYNWDVKQASDYLLTYVSLDELNSIMAATELAQLDARQREGETLEEDGPQQSSNAVAAGVVRHMLSSSARKVSLHLLNRPTLAADKSKSDDDFDNEEQREPSIAPPSDLPVDISFSTLNDLLANESDEEDHQVLTDGTIMQAEWGCTDDDSRIATTAARQRNATTPQELYLSHCISVSGISSNPSEGAIKLGVLVSGWLNANIAVDSSLRVVSITTNIHGDLMVALIFYSQYTKNVLRRNAANHVDERATADLPVKLVESDDGHAAINDDDYLSM